MKPRAEVYDPDDWSWGIGCATTLTQLPLREPPPREFPPGFAGANPGPSHDETPPKRRPKSKAGHALA